MKRTTFYVVSVTLVAAIGGLIFGFDTAIVAGATRYMKEQFSLNSLQEGWVVAVVLIGCMFGAGLAGPDQRPDRAAALHADLSRPLPGIGRRLRPAADDRGVRRLPVRRRPRHRLGGRPFAALHRRDRAGPDPGRPRIGQPAGHRHRHPPGLLRQLAVRRGRSVELALDVRDGGRAFGRLFPAPPARPREPALAGQERPGGRSPERPHPGRHRRSRGGSDPRYQGRADPRRGIVPRDLPAGVTAAAPHRRRFSRLPAGDRHQRHSLLRTADIRGRRFRPDVGHRPVDDRRLGQHALHRRGHRPGGQGRPAAAAARRHRRHGRFARPPRRRLQGPGPAGLGPAPRHPRLHRLLRFGHGAAGLGRHGRDLPHQGPRQRHGRWPRSSCGWPTSPSP